MVVNNDTSNNNLSVVANSVTFVLTPGEGQCFIWDGTAWGPTDLGITSLPVPVTQGGTGLATITDHGVMVGSGTGAVTPLSAGTNGQVLVGSTGADPVFATITDGEGIDTTLGAGTLTIACEDASTSNKGVTVYSGTTKALAGTDTASAMTPADVAAANAVTMREPDQGVAMTYAASGSTGILVADNDNIDFGTGNFTLVWKGSLPDWTPAALLFNKIESASKRWYLTYNAGGTITLFIRDDVGTTINVESTALSLVDGTTHVIAHVITRETASVAGSHLIYVDGVLSKTVVIPAGTPASATNTGVFQIFGYSTARYAGTTHHAYTFNRALTAAEELSRYRNGVAPQHRRASQTALTSGTLLAGQEYTIDTFVAGDDFSNIATVVSGTINTTGCIFVATGTTPTTWTNSSSLRATGATLILEPEGIQPAPGQWLDSSSNNLHALQPATGSSLTRSKRDFTIKWTNTWAGTHEAQYIGGVNQAVLPANCYIESIIGVITGATIEDIIIGDGSDTDRWVAATTGLAAGTVSFTLANRISDGTNYKLVVDPDANFTGSIAFTIRGIILQ
jgi:hypothetical protein